MESSVSSNRPARKKIKYIPIMNDREELTYSEILSQCVHVLDIASQYAAEKADVESLIKLSHDWRELCGFFVEDYEEGEEPIITSRQIGFALEDLTKQKIELEASNGTTED